MFYTKAINCFQAKRKSYFLNKKSAFYFSSFTRISCEFDPLFHLLCLDLIS